MESLSDVSPKNYSRENRVANGKYQKVFGLPPKFNFRNIIINVDGKPTHRKMEPSTSASANESALSKLSIGRSLFHSVSWVDPIVCYWVSPIIILGEEHNNWLLGASVPTLHSVSKRGTGFTLSGLLFLVQLCAKRLQKRGFLSAHLVLGPVAGHD